MDQARRLFNGQVSVLFLAESHCCTGMVKPLLGRSNMALGSCLFGLIAMSILLGGVPAWVSVVTALNKSISISGVRTSNE